MNNKFLILIFTSFIAFSSCQLEKKQYTFVFYNVENLFDTIDDPQKWDDDFTPSGKLKFTTERYQDKLLKISKVLSSVDTNSLPAIIGLCEIENRSVLEDLIKEKKLASGNYGIAHAESPDKRGIDCALLYNQNEFKTLKQDVIGIEFPWEPDYKTRDILYVQGVIGKLDTLHLFVNHWPSRRGGQEKSEKNRVFVAEQLRLAVTNLQSKNPNAKIVIMGDFNDEPNNKSSFESLAAGNDKSSGDPTKLYNLLFDLDAQGKGSYNYRGNWNMLDNLIVSNSLFTNTNGIHTTHNSAAVFSEEWLCYKNQAGILVPSRTYGGPNYYGGYSDHFPVYFQLSN